MTAFFFFLLALDWLSLKFPGDTKLEKDFEKQALDEAESRKSERRRFVEPVMKVLSPPCDFCLRNMSVMFTPSFILIPARELIPGKEIGLLTAWFTISQVLGYVFPVLLHKLLTWVSGQAGEIREKRREMKKEKRMHQRRPSNATLAGAEIDKRMSFSGGHRLGSIATGLSGLTAVVTAPVTHLSLGGLRYNDERNQLTRVQVETARQQGDPAVATPAEIASLTGSPLINVNFFQPHQHFPRHHHHHHHHQMTRGRSATRNESPQRFGSAFSPRPRSSSPRARSLGPVSVNTSPALEQTISLSPFRFNFSNVAMERANTAPPSRIAFKENLETAAYHRAVEDSGEVTVAPTPRISFGIEEIGPSEDVRRGRSLASPSAAPLASPLASPLNEYSLGASSASRRPSVTFGSENAASPSTTSVSRRPSLLPIDPSTRRGSRCSDITMNSRAEDGAMATKNSLKENSTSENTPRMEDEERSIQASSMSYRPDAVERLSEWMADLITPMIYLTLFLVGIPLFYLIDFPLPLFLGVNLLTFLAAITIVPPKVRRYLHPILSTSVATVLILWAFGEIKNLTLKETLAYYSHDAKYTVLWDLKGYKGPVPGAGDVLFSTLDAGIVALAIPMYRYRRDLAENFTKMMVVLLPCASLSLFVWPLIGRLFGLDPIRSLAFSARFMSTPLAIEMANNVGADESITVILVVVTGIIAAILKEPFFKMMRVSMDDHICVGVTMGSTSGAIGASSLIYKPRVMAVASLAFVLFGAILLIAAAIPPVVDIVRNLAGA
ncbi:hypothetical protein IE53DRAFT_389699 [Violaceomyces palustris]|uniref:Uncharacterized protein n=1 Tax=Violaceomyces palustris TaxID=1673888 RepID=A0ACD0NQT5_9BASI|nr:hypothetical protein IE53DRAFT_389699 [Violaceomyces palustris]